MVDVRKAALDDAAHELRCLFLEGHKAKGEPWYPEHITLLTYAHQRVKKLRSEK